MTSFTGLNRLVELPVNTRRALIAMFFMGIILIAAASMYQGDVNHIPKDKIIHFTAYTLLSITLTLGFNFRYTVVGLLGLAGISYAVEFVQPWNDRSKDFFDAWANTAGICVGAGLGFLLRLGVNFLWGEWQSIRLRHYLKSFKKDDVILDAGQKSEYFYIIKKGSVDVFHNEDDTPVLVSTLNVDAVFGLVSDALHTQQEETIIAKEDCVVYELNYENLIQEAGGSHQPIALLLRTLIKQYDTQIDLLVKEKVEPTETSHEENAQKESDIHEDSSTLVTKAVTTEETANEKHGTI